MTLSKPDREEREKNISRVIETALELFLSDGIAAGAVQISAGGQPIVMLADHQTTGGYTKIANVITADFRLAGQLKGGDKVRFEQISVAKAQELLRCQRASRKLLAHLVNTH